MKRVIKISITILALFSLVLIATPAYLHIDDSKLCLKCHSNYEKSDILAKHTSVQVTCSDCHSGTGFAENINANKKRAVEIIGYSIGFYDLPDRSNNTVPNCLKCHTIDKELKTASGLYPHAINSNQSSCSSCHDIHEQGFGNELCGNCHTNAFDTLNSQESGHQFSCSQCHIEHGSIPSCAECHNNEHGQKYENCLKCHTEPHAPKNIVFESNTKETCEDCHPDIVDVFRDNPSKHMQIDCSFCHLKHKMKPLCTYCHTPHDKGKCVECHTDAHNPIVSE